MTLEAVAAIIAVIISIVGAIVAYVNSRRLDVERLARLEVRVETLWEFLFRHSVSEAVSKGLADVNSPLVINEKVREWYKPLEKDLKDFCVKLESQQLSVSDILISVEREFGDALLAKVAIPNRITHDACLIIAVALGLGDKFVLPDNMSKELRDEIDSFSKELIDEIDSGEE